MLLSLHAYLVQQTIVAFEMMQKRLNDMAGSYQLHSFVMYHLECGVSEKVLAVTELATMSHPLLDW
jgi:hypothetical protein